MSLKHLSVGSIQPVRLPGKLRFYSMRFCPFAHRVQLVLDAKKIPYDVVFVNLSAKPEWLLDINPMGKVPSIVLENGDVLYESLIVTDYLDEAYPENKLYPKDPLEKAKDKLLIDRFGGIISMMYKLFVDTTADQGLFEEALKALEYLEREIVKRGTQFIGGDKPGMVDLMIWPWFERADIIKIIKGDKFSIPHKRFPKMLEWMAAMKEDPTVKNYYLKPEVHAKYMQSHSSGKPQYDLLV
uniref:Glutathione S-transferase omega 2 n=1 Tax=Meteorus pulchricornis TaxID=51522 RepID=A0A4D6J7J0_9HYME|nr:glutathione S-transferase omega 2 [Meteorus pulchricornis]